MSRNIRPLSSRPRDGVSEGIHTPLWLKSDIWLNKACPPVRRLVRAFRSTDIPMQMVEYHFVRRCCASPCECGHITLMRNKSRWVPSRRLSPQLFDPAVFRWAMCAGNMSRSGAKLRNDLKLKSLANPMGDARAREQRANCNTWSRLFVLALLFQYIDFAIRRPCEHRARDEELKPPLTTRHTTAKQNNAKQASQTKPKHEKRAKPRKYHR